MDQQKNSISRFGEVFRFVFSGGVCFLVEYAVLVALKELAHMHIVPATAIAFLVSVCVNYLMCVRWVFNDAEQGGASVRMQFALTSVAGMFLNMFLMWVMSCLWMEDQILFSLLGFTFKQYMLNKAIATLLVMIWNYFSKRHVLRKKHA